MPSNVKMDLALVNALPENISKGTVYMHSEDGSSFIKVGVSNNKAVTIYEEEKIATDTKEGIIKCSSTYIHDDFMQDTAVNPADGKLYACQSDVYYMTPTGTIDATSTSQQVPSAKAVYDFITSYASTQEIGPSLIPAPAVIIDSSSTAPSLDCLYGNKVYIWESPLTSLNINSVADSHYESTLYFTTGSTFSISIPQNMKRLNIVTFIPNTSYVISIKDLVICMDSVKTYIDSQPIVFSSSQLMSGVIEPPTVIDSADSAPVINDTLPNAIYRFETVTSITMHNVPANSLETLVYFTAGSQRVTLNLDSSSGLKITAGSTLYLVSGDFVMSIKDGVIAISGLMNA